MIFFSVDPTNGIHRRHNTESNSVSVVPINPDNLLYKEMQTWMNMGNSLVEFVTNDIPVDIVDDLKQQVLIEMASSIDCRIKLIRNSIPECEVEVYETKYQQALDYIKNNQQTEFNTPLFIEASFTGETIPVLVDKILALNAKHKLLLGAVPGLRRKYTSLINSSTSPEEIYTHFSNFKAEWDSVIGVTPV